MKPAVTQWFCIREDGNPARAGWYECGYWKGDDDPRMRRWDGKMWWLPCGVSASFGERPDADYVWRDLVEDPNRATAQGAAGQDGAA